MTCFCFCLFFLLEAQCIIVLPFTGEPIFKFKTSERKWPIEAGTWNHRLAACYRAFQEQPSNPNVSIVLERGLTSVKCIHPDIPWRVWERFINVHNTFHKGSAANFLEYMQEAVQLEGLWEQECSRTGLHSHNPRYKAFYKDFVLKRSMFFTDWDNYRKALSLTHNLQQKYGIFDDLKKYFNSTVDFLNRSTRSTTADREQKIKKADKRPAFVPWTDDEKRKFMKVVPPLVCAGDPQDDPGTRAITAIDDFLQAMVYAEQVVKAGVFMQFLFEARVCLNGKDLRVWSSVRPELQSIFLSAFDAAYDFVSTATTSRDDGKKVNAFELAKALCETFVNKPIVMTVMADDEELVVKRIAIVMNSKYVMVAQPLKNFLKINAKLPAMMHDIVRNTAAVFGSTEQMEKFIGLRFRYLLHLLNVACQCTTDLKVTDVDTPTLFFYGRLAQHVESMDSAQLDQLISFDVVLSSHEWGKQWTHHLQKATSVECVVKSIKTYLKRNDDEKKNQTAAATTSETTKQKNLKPDQPDVTQLTQQPAVSSLLMMANLRSSLKHDGTPDDKKINESDATADGTANPGDGDDGNGNGKTSSKQTAQLPINEFNSYIVDSFKTTIVKSQAWEALQLPENKIDGCFFKIFELKLNAAMWSAYEHIAPKDLDQVQIDLGTANKSGAVYFKLPAPEVKKVRLPLVHRLAQGKPKGSYLCCNVFGVDWWMEPCKDPASSDYCVPGWAAKTVTRADQAFFHQEELKVDVLVRKIGSSYTDIDVIYLPSAKHLHDELVKKYENLPHWVFSLTFQCLTPNEHIADRLLDEVNDARNNMEKQVRSMITTASKAASKAVLAAEKAKSKGPKGSGRGQGGKGGRKLVDPMVEMFTSVGMVMPEDPEKRHEALQEIIDREEKLEEMVEKAKSSVQLPDKIPLTRLLGSDEKQSRSARAKVMQEALLAAKATTDTAADQGDDGANQTVYHIGPQAAAKNMKDKGIITVVNQRSKKGDQSALAKDVVSRGKHLLK
ncbi:unnamed protein product [Durusdinium trenchii]|uniref:Uncharacterized protein n=1 Tax=Durusdinium trenchii TaxID=1381693 RepID=A0ABP0SYU4_9DINO